MFQTKSHKLFLFLLALGWIQSELQAQKTLKLDPNAIALETPAKPKKSEAPPTYLSSPTFKIPFDVDGHKAELSEVQLWVSTDDGKNWQMHGAQAPNKKHFEFRAAAEGLYLFSVQTMDHDGNAFPSQSPPLRVYVDTSKPMSAVRADVDGEGRLVVEVRVADENLVSSTAILKARTDRDPSWQPIQMGAFNKVGEMLQSRTILDLPPCREVGLVFAVRDEANNQGESTYQYTMPRTAAGEKDLKLASTPKGQLNQTIQVLSQPAPDDSKAGPNFENAKAWTPSSQGSSLANSNMRAPNVAEKKAQRTPPRPTITGQLQGPGQLASSGSTLSLESSAGDGATRLEELPAPDPTRSTAKRTQAELRVQEPPAEIAQRDSGEGTAVDRAFHCKSRAFSLDYSVEALGGTTLSEIELWGTEDGGRTWEVWGQDPDRQSPFDVEVGNNGLFGFRMVLVGKNGLVSNRPKAGDAADVWINVDTDAPSSKIMRAVYGEGPEDGMLVIDYKCSDGHLVDRPVALSYSEGLDGPWTSITTGMKNTGIYLWKAGAQVPEQIYLKLEVTDKAGNVGVHRLDVPIDTKGLAPRGRIQGFRPILN
ncbi:MAG: hypothetical protein AB8B50_00890 [Pirellulaceae bacterium]